MPLPSRWSPFRQIGSDRFGSDPFADVEQMFREFSLSPFTGGRERERALEMRLDVNEDDQAYFVNVDMPGVRKDDIDISVEGNQVTVTAEVRRGEKESKQKSVHSERFYGKAFRSFTLPMEIDSSKAEAAYDGGVLTLTLPKLHEGVASRRINVS